MKTRNSQGRVMRKQKMLNQVRCLSNGEAAWVGAMIEAEGTLSIPQDDFGSRVNLSVVNTDVEIISTLLRFVGTGNIRAVTSNSPLSKKPLWSWNLQRMEDVYALGAQIIPWMTTKGDRLAQLLVDRVLPGFDITTQVEIGKVLRNVLGSLNLHSDVGEFLDNTPRDDYATRPTAE